MKLASIQQLTAGMVIAEDVYSSGRNLLVAKGTTLAKLHIDVLKEYGIRYVHVTNRLDKMLREAPIRVSPEVAAILPHSEPVISRELRHKAIGSLEKVFTALTLEEGDLHTASVQVIKEVDTVVEQLVDTLSSDKLALVNINDLKSYDEYTYHHSLSVAVLSIAIGQYLGFDRAALNDLGKCGFLHDIGKTSIPVNIIRKPSKLNDDEFHLMRTHSMVGYNHLLTSKVMNAAILTGVLHHHEKVDGTGYPHGLRGTSISLFAKILAVGDVYDALTSNRPYRVPNQPAEAIEYIMGGVDTSFDYDIVQAFVKKLDLYPVGSFVRLSNGRTAVVVDNRNQMRPLIRMVDTGMFVDLVSDRSYHNVTIERTMPEGSVIVG